MATRLMLVAHAPTAATRLGAFPDDEDVLSGEPVGPVAVRSVQVLAGPERRCRRTVSALGWSDVVDPAPADLDAGRWRGRTLHSLLADPPRRSEPAEHRLASSGPMFRG